ncbi:MAG: S41 family peptidase [Bacteroidaceae bacterium]|nr:S41 family peptidase [Bacteroidaceae bacterium]
MKNKSILFLFLLVSLPLLGQKTESHNAQIARHLELFDDIYRQIDLYYVDTLSADTTIGWAIKSMLGHVDPFTQYYPEDDDELRQMATGKYAGIGSVIRYNTKAKRAMIVEPYEGTPSQLAGLQAGDIILSIDGQDMLSVATPEVSNMLRGEPGTSFELRVRRPGEEEPLTFRLTRKTIQMPTVPYYGMVGDGMGYIYLSSFASGSTQEVRHALADLRGQGMTRLVLDLRDNGGGSIDEAINIVNLFVGKGEKVVYTRGKMASSNREYFTTGEPLDTVTPMVVLVNGSTASAAEILSGSLQDMDRAVVMGTRTYGKGLVQAIHEVSDRGNLKITISRYYIPSGRCIQAYDYRHLTEDGRVGTVPDSLTRVFHTRGGREVRDGGGIKPDVEAREDSLGSIVYDVMNSDEMLLYVTRYVRRHDHIAPAGSFALSDADYDEFVQYMQESGFESHRRTDEVLDLLRKAARLEGVYDEAQTEFQQLEARLKTDLASELQRQRAAIRPYLEEEIVSRYYFQRGRAQQLLRTDKVFDRAVELLHDPDAYKRILHP